MGPSAQLLTCGGDCSIKGPRQFTDPQAKLLELDVLTVVLAECSEGLVVVPGRAVHYHRRAQAQSWREIILES